MFQYSDQAAVTAIRHWEALGDWYRTPLGRRLQRAEDELLDGMLSTLFGYHALSIGVPWDHDPLRASRTPGCHRLEWSTGNGGSWTDLVGVPEALPIATDSVDVVLLPHVLECRQDPDAILDEVDRILIPQGHVVVIGFNPFSLWGVRRFGGGGQGPWRQRFLAPMAVNHWLAIRGYERIALRYCYHLPPLNSFGTAPRLEWLGRFTHRYLPWLGASYLLLARKRVTTMTPLRPRWRSRRLVVTQGGVTNRNSDGAAT